MRSACPVHQSSPEDGAALSGMSTERVKSTILGSKQNEVWTYPSSQMFYNALKKKKKAEEVSEENIDTIVSIHNTMNENTWNEVLKYEALHYERTKGFLEQKIAIVEELEQDQEISLPASKEMIVNNIKAEVVPRLVKFQGRPHDLTPKAWVNKYIFGNNNLFDRHDWVVQRNVLATPNRLSTSESRYVIDYYYDESKGRGDEQPTHLHDMDAVKSIRIDARPAIDSFQSVLDRLKLSYLSFMGKTPDISLLQLSQQTMGNSPREADSSPASKQPDHFSHVKEQALLLKEKCKSTFEALQSCDSEENCAQLSLKMMVCMGSIVCPRETEAVFTVEDNEENLDKLSACLERFEKQAKVAG